MSNDYPSQTVAELVRERLSRSRVFQRHEIDFCCGGGSPLSDACRAAGADLDEVVAELAASDAEVSADEEVDWAHAPLSALTDHIVQKHHCYLKTELPMLDQMARSVLDAHGEAHPELHDLKRVFDALSNELFAHMMKEEHVLFPLIKSIESADSKSKPLPQAHCGSVDNPIHVMEDEHRHAGEALVRLREITGGYIPPADACTTYRALYLRLEELEADLHVHIHKENNILHPLASQLEHSLAQSSLART